MDRTSVRAGEQADGMSDLELLSAALQDAMAAQREGVIVGPGLDEVALARAERRARRRDRARLANVIPAVSGDVA
jgi:hypothetical protein